MISREEIDHLAALARVKLTDEEAESLRKDISSILEYVGQVSSFEAGGSGRAAELRTVMRDDEPRAEGDPLWGTRDALLRALPRREGERAVVRKILEK